MDVGPQNHNGDGRLRPKSKIVVYMDPLGMLSMFMSMLRLRVVLHAYVVAFIYAFVYLVGHAYVYVHVYFKKHV